MKRPNPDRGDLGDHGKDLGDLGKDLGDLDYVGLAGAGPTTERSEPWGNRVRVFRSYGCMCIYI